jgi:hypothetical protein
VSGDDLEVVHGQVCAPGHTRHSPGVNVIILKNNVEVKKEKKIDTNYRYLGIKINHNIVCKKNAIL